MDKTEFSMFVLIRTVAASIVATQPLNLFPYQSVAASCVGIAALLWTFYLVGLWMAYRGRRESNRSTRNRSTRNRNRKA